MGVTIAAAVVVALSYLLGTFPTALLVGRRFGFDPTKSGSGNPGASNAVRVGGRRAGVMVLIGDAGKGVVAAAAGAAVDGRTLAWSAGAAAVVGHLWPVTRRMRGGKGVATGAGVALVCAPGAFLVAAVAFAALLAATGKAAVGSLAAAGLVPVVAWMLGQTPVEVGLATAVAVVIVSRHRSNIARLLRGAEADLRPRHPGTRKGRDRDAGGTAPPVG